MIGCGVQPHKVVTVYSGRDLSRFNPDKIDGNHIRKEFGISPDAPLVLVPPGDDKALASAIVKLVKDKELAARLATKGREFVEQNMAEEIMVKRTEAVYLDVLRGKGGI